MADTLDDLIREFDKGTTLPPPSVPPPEVSPAEVVHHAEQARHRRDAAVADQQHQANALKQATAEFKAGGIDDDDGLVTGYLLNRALENPKFAAASAARETDRARWQRELAMARNDYLERTQSRGNALRSDIEAAHAAVRNSNQVERPEPTLDLKAAERMSDLEWKAFTESLPQNGYSSRAQVWSDGRGSSPRRR